MSLHGKMIRPLGLYALCAIAAVLIAVFFHSILLDFVGSMWDQAREWGVNPVIFVVLLLGTAYHYYKGWFLIAKGLYVRDGNTLLRGVVLNRITWAIPWVYVVAFGRDYPQWILFAGVGTLVLLSAIFVHNYRRPNYVNRMTNSTFGRLVGKRLGLDSRGVKEKS